MSVFSGIINFFRNVVPSFGIRHHKMYSTITDYFDRFCYFNSNSIYLENILNKISNDVAMLKFKHIKITKKENEEIPKMTWFEHSDLSNVLCVSPNEFDTPINFWAKVTRKMLSDQVAAVIPSFENDRITSIVLADSILKPTDDSKIIQVNAGDKTYEMDSSSIWLFENPKKNVTTSLDQMTRLIDDNLKNISLKLSSKGNSLKGLLKYPTNIDDESLVEKSKFRVNKILEGAKESGIGVLQRYEEFQELQNEYSTIASSDLNFLKEQFYNAFGINEKLFNCDYTENQFRAYFSSVLKIYQRVISEEINRKYFTKTARTQGQKLLVYYDMYDISSLRDLNEFAFKMKYSGIMSANEIREIFGYGSYLGGEVFETNKNAIRINDSSILQGEDL